MEEKYHIFGRKRELANLQSVFETVESGKGRIVLLSGEAGVGKTLLAEESLSKSQLRFFTGRASEDFSPPYEPVTAILRECIRRMPITEANKNLLFQHLAILLPELGAPAENTDRQMLVEGISNTLANAAKEHPTAILLDDLQWADDATLELLPALSDRLQNESLLILGIYRNDEIPRGHRLRWMRNELRRRRRLSEIILEPLDQAESVQLMTKALGDSPHPDLISVIYEQTRGMPLFVEELSNALVSCGCVQKGANGIELEPGKDVPIPESIRDAILLRIDNLSNHARKILEVAAVAGMAFDLNAISELAEEEAGLDELFDRNLIFEAKIGIGTFRHALTREAVISEIIWSRRRNLNSKIAAHLEASGALPELIAEHWLAANELGKARLALIESARHFCQLYAYRDAAKAGQRALKIWPEGEEEAARISTLEQLAHCAQVNGQLNDAARALREIIESPIVMKNPARLAQTQRSLAVVYGLQGAWEQSLTARNASAEAFQKANLIEETATEWLAAAGRYTGMLRLEKAIELCDCVFELAEKTHRYDIQARSLGLKGNVLSILGKSREGLEVVNEGLSIALKHNLTAAAAEVYRRLGSTLEYAADYASSREAYYTAYNYCQTEGASAQAQLCLSCMSYVLFRTGDWKQCLKTCREVLNDDSTPESSRSVALGTIGLIRSYSGETRQARKQLHESLNFAHRSQTTAMEFICIWGLAQLAEFEGNDSEAERYYREALEIRERIQEQHDAMTVLISATHFFASRGFEKESNICAEVLASIAASTGKTEALGTLAYALGEIALMNNKYEDAIKQFSQALSHLEKLEIPVEMLKIEFRLGIAYSHADDRDPAVRHFNNAYRIARNLGARSLSAQIADALESVGELAEEHRNPEAKERRKLGGLTRRQVEVARLIAEGLTNKEIANKIFLSPRTVEMHVANLLDRLDCRSRSEAVRKAGELGLLE